MPIQCTRDRVAQEILTTEQNYVRSLHALVQVFKDPIAKRIEEGSIGLTETNFHIIFSNIEEIIEVPLGFALVPSSTGTWISESYTKLFTICHLSSSPSPPFPPGF
jgi:hypothetical protein